MLFWKVDEETIRCLINKDEISSLGFDLVSLSEDAGQMEAFLETIVENSRNYIDWRTDNGIQNYIARPLPADQFLITISCTFQDEIIDRNISQIRKMTGALRSSVTEDRLGKIEALTGEEKEKAFEDLSRDLYAICSGEGDPRGTYEDGGYTGDAGQTAVYGAGAGQDAAKGETKSSASPSDRKTRTEEVSLPDRKLVFSSLDEIITFAGILNKDMHYTSSLYKSEQNYVLLVRFDRCRKDADAVSFVLAAEEYGASCYPVRYDEAYMMEHGKELIHGNALSVLSTM